MQGPAHLVISWFTAEAAGIRSARGRRVVALAGLSPDFDVIAYIGAYFYFGFDRDLAYERVWVTVHHHYTHGLTYAVAIGLLAWWWCARASRRGSLADSPRRVASYAALAVLLHVFFDLIAAGPRYPVFPLWPFSDFGWTVAWSWELRDWPNQIITAVCLLAIPGYAWLAGRSPLEAINYRLDEWVVAIARQQPTAESSAAAANIAGLRRETFVRLCVYGGLFLICAAIVAPVASDLF